MSDLKLEALKGLKAMEVFILSLPGQAIEQLPYKNPQNADEEGLNAVKMLWIIAKSLQGDFKPDYNNPDQKKWWPWFKWDASKSAFVFSRTYYYFGYTFASVGVRLVFPTEAIARYLGEQFIALHNKVLSKS